MTETQIATIQAQSRENLGKSQLRQLRESGFVPGVLYSKKLSEAKNIKVEKSSLPKSHTHSSIVALSIDGAVKKVLMREVQVDVLNDQPIHFDFQEVEPQDKINASIPLRFVGLTKEQEKEGSFTPKVRYLHVRCSVENLPAQINVDVSALKADQSLMLFDVPLPPSVRIRTGKGKNVALASIVKS
jgi:large subunit ribosomal protein L25